MYQNCPPSKNGAYIPMLFGCSQDFSSLPPRDSDSRLCMQSGQSTRAPTVAPRPFHPDSSRLSAQFLASSRLHPSSDISPSHFGYHASSYGSLSPGGQSSSSMLSSSSLASPRRREPVRTGDSRLTFQRSVSPSYLSPFHLPSVQDIGSKTPSFPSSTGLHAPLPFPSSFSSGVQNNTTSITLPAEGKGSLDLPSLGFRTRAGAAAAARAAAAALARGEPVDPLLFGGPSCETSRSSSRTEQETVREASAIEKTRKGGTVLGPVTPKALTFKNPRCQHFARSPEIAEVPSPPVSTYNQTTDKVEKHSRLLLSSQDSPLPLSVHPDLQHHCPLVPDSDQFFQPTVHSYSGVERVDFSRQREEKGCIGIPAKEEEETRKGTRIVSAKAAVDEGSRTESTDPRPLLLRGLAPSTQEVMIGEEETGGWTGECFNEDDERSNNNSDSPAMFSLCPPSPFSSSTPSREQGDRGAGGAVVRPEPQSKPAEKMKSQVTRLRLSSSLLGGGAGDSSSLACPPILPMSRKDQIMVDRLSRKVNASSFATVLKAYLIIKTRVAAQRANKEYQQEQKRGAPFPFLNRRSSRVALESPPPSASTPSRLIHHLKTSHHPSSHASHHEHDGTEVRDFVPAPPGKRRPAFHQRLSSVHQRRDEVSAGPREGKIPSTPPPSRHTKASSSRSPSPLPHEVSHSVGLSREKNHAAISGTTPRTGSTPAEDDDEAQSLGGGGGETEEEEVKPVGAVGRMKACQSLLEQRLGFLGFRTVLSAGDGNCQFRSCSWNLFGTEAYHKIVRSRAVKHMRQHQDEYGIFFEGEGEFDKYIRNMSRPGTWGDELCVRAIADSFQCTIHIITSTDTNWYLRYDPQVDGKTVEAVRHIFLTYISPIHYNSFSIEDINSSDADSNSNKA